MRNKRHNIIDDAWTMKESSMGGSAHTVRVGLVVNTVMNAMPIIVGDVVKLVVEKPKFDAAALSKDLPVLLHVQSKELMLAILVVHDKSTNHIQCYPFNNLNEEGKWWLYEMAFDLVPGGFIEVRPVHPLVEEFDPTKEMMNHLEALATIVGSFLQRLQNEEISVVQSSDDFTKINKKRVSNNKEPIINDWNLVYAG